VLGAVFAKVISTASNYLFSPATNLIEDVMCAISRQGLEQAGAHRLPAGCSPVGLLGALQAVYAESILQKMLYAYTVYSAALTPVVLAAFYSKRVTAWGAVAAIASGTAVTLAWTFRSESAFSAHSGARDASSGAIGCSRHGGGQPVYPQTGAGATGAVCGLGLKSHCTLRVSGARAVLVLGFAEHQAAADGYLRTDNA